MTMATGGDPDGDGFEEAFASLFLPAFRIAHRILGDTDEAEDVAAEALARALRRWPKVSALGHRDAWVLRVAANVAIDRARRVRRGQMLKLPAASAAMADPTESVVVRLALVSALRTLSRRQREVVALRYLADLNQADVAVSLGISENSVKKHAQRALAALRVSLGTTWEEATLALD